MPRMSKENAKLHREWAKKIRERDKWCQICGPGLALAEGWKAPKLAAHHLIPREFDEYRWDIDNGMLLCVHHHVWGKFSAHKNPIWFADWLIMNRYDVIKQMREKMDINLI